MGKGRGMDRKVRLAVLGAGLIGKRRRRCLRAIGRGVVKEAIRLTR